MKIAITFKNNFDSGYDLIDDFWEIEAAMASFYHLTTREILNLPHRLFFHRLANVSNTKFNEIVYIRTETNKDKIKNFSKFEKEIYNNYKEQCKQREKLYRLDVSNEKKQMTKKEELAMCSEIINLFKSMNK